MKNKILFIIFFLSQKAAYTQSISEKLDTLLSTYAQQYKFNGSVLVAKKGKVLLEKGYGFKNATNKLPNEATTVFQIGSVTKQFTAALILKLQEQGKLKVTDKLSKYFPDYPKADSITLYNLLTHTSGIYNYTNDSRFMNSKAIKPQSRETMIALFKNKPLDFSPGTQYRYSNSGYMLLGYIVEDITRKPWEKVMRAFILSPLQMKQSGFDFAGLISKDKATGYFALDAKGNQPATTVDSTVAYSAGSLYASVGDLYKWERSIYSNKILKKESWNQAFTPNLEKYGFGWIIDSLYGKKIIWHNGGIYGFNSHLLRFPDDGLVIVLLSNKTSPLLGTIANNIAAAAYDLPYDLPKEKKEIVVPEEILKQYVGEYELATDFLIIVTLEGGKLKAQATGQQKFDLFAERDNRFFLKVVDAQLEFIKGGDGKVEKLILFQGGAKTDGKKIK